MHLWTKLTRSVLQMSLSAVKNKISTHCGTRPEDMALSLKDESGQTFAQLTEDHRPLGYYSPYDGQALLFTRRLHK